MAFGSDWGILEPDGTVRPVKMFDGDRIIRENADVIEDHLHDFAQRTIGREEFDGVMVSTVFLALDHGWGAFPKWFETMVFWEGCEAWDQYQERYTTMKEAREGHRRILAEVKSAYAAIQFARSNNVPSIVRFLENMSL